MKVLGVYCTLPRIHSFVSNDGIIVEERSPVVSIIQSGWTLVAALKEGDLDVI